MKFKTFTEETNVPNEEPQLSEQTRGEQELGRKLAAQNAAAFAKAQQMRAAEETAKAELETKPPTKEPVFPVAGRKAKE